MSGLITLTDGVRWWGALAGMIGIADVLQWVGAKTEVEQFNSVKSAAVGKSGIYLFLIIAGSAIPASNRYGWFGPQSPAFLTLILFAWLLVSGGGWLLAVSRSKNQQMMEWTAALAFVVTLFASMLTAHG
jgi:hypothetical protein